MQAAVKIVLEPVFEAAMLDCSFGFRPRRSAHDALQVLIDERWRGRRWVAAGAAAGVGLGFADPAVIAAVAPKVSATVGADNYPQVPSAHVKVIGGTALIHVVPVPLHPSVSAGMIVVAVALVLAGALLVGAFASWRIAVLRPADALAPVA